MSRARRDHWQAVYTEKPVDRVSWYQRYPQASLDALARIGAGPARSLVDIGAGASPLVASLAQAGWDDLAALDLSDAALALSREAAGEGHNRIGWIAADVTAWQPARRYDIWHDRAVFHFLTQPAEREAYRATLDRALHDGGHAVIAAFAPDGPDRCSGLAVQRYDAPALARELGAGLTLEAEWREVHHTPQGAPQHFQWCIFRKEPT